MQQKISLVYAGVSEASKKKWQEAGIYKINRIHMPLEGKAMYGGFQEDVLMQEGYAYVMTNCSSLNFSTIPDQNYLHLYLDFQSIPPLITVNPIEINLSKDYIMLHLFRVVQNIIRSITDEKNKGVLNNKHVNEFIQITKLVEVMVIHLNKNYNLSFIHNKIIEEAIQFMEEHYNEHISNSDIANFLHVDMRYLLRLFAKYMSMSPYQYLQQFRTEQAIKYLSEGKPVSEVAFLCGYQSENAFRISFKKVTGCTPMAMLKQKRFKL